MMISVIIPVFNVEKYLAACLISILKQSYQDFEIICVDDCSTDNSYNIMKEFSNKDNRIKIFSNESNQGPGFCRNRGIDNADGEYILFLDSDDYLSFNALELLYKNSKSTDSDVVIFKMARFINTDFNFNAPAFDFSNYFDETVDFNNFTFTYKDIRKEVLNSSFSPCLKLYKKSFLRNNNILFPKGIKIGEDVPTHVKVLLSASKLSFVPEFLYNYRLSNFSSSTHNLSYFKDVFTMIKLVEDVLLDNNSFDEFEKEFYLFEIQQILQYLNRTNSNEYFIMAKVEFEKINQNISGSAEFSDYLKNSLLNQWNDYEKVLFSNTIEDYLSN